MIMNLEFQLFSTVYLDSGFYCTSQHVEVGRLKFLRDTLWLQILHGIVDSSVCEEATVNQRFSQLAVEVHIGRF